MMEFSKALRSPHLRCDAARTLEPTPAFHTVATIYPSVTPISAKLPPFISKAAVRDTYYAETLSPHHAREPLNQARVPMTILFLIACENPRQINARFYRVNHSFALRGKGSGIRRGGSSSRVCFFTLSTFTCSPRNSISLRCLKRKKKRNGGYSLQYSHFYGGDYKPDDDDC